MKMKVINSGDKSFTAPLRATLILEGRAKKVMAKYDFTPGERRDYNVVVLSEACGELIEEAVDRWNTTLQQRQNIDDENP